MDNIKKYYNSNSYIIEHGDYFKKYHDLQVSFLEKALSLTKDDLIADLCCGNGRHSISLAVKGYSIEGIDYSSYLIKEAIKTAKLKNLNCNFYIKDIFTIDVKEKYNKLYWIFPDMSLDCKQVIKKAYEMVKKNSLALFDIRNVFNLASYFFETKSTDSVFNPKDFKLYTISGSEKRDAPDLFYTYKEIYDYCQTSGFNVEKTYGFYDSSEYTLFSPRMIFLVKK